jgi:hypothetical protein
MNTRTRLLAVAAACAAIWLVGCSNPSATKPTQKDNEAQMLKFAQCMRDHGVQVSDPRTSGQGGNIQIQGGGSGPNSGLTQDQLQQAQDACKQYLPSGGNGPGQLDQKKKDAFLKYAQCMRDHGINFPDPQFDSNGNVRVQIQGGEGGVDPRSQTFQDASKACQHFMSAAGMAPPGAASSGSGS